ADRVPLRAALRDGRPRRELFGPRAAAGPAGGNAVERPGRPHRIDVDVTVRAPAGASRAGLGLLLRDRFGLTFRSPMLRLPESGDGTVSVDVDALAGAPLGAPAAPLSLAGLVVSYGAEYGTYRFPSEDSSAPGELAVRRLGVAEGPGGPSVTVPVPAGAPGWTLKTPLLNGGAPAAELLPAPDGAAALPRLRYRGGEDSAGGIQLGLVPGGAPAPELPGIATRGYLAAVGAGVGDLVPVPLGGATVPVRVTAAVGSLPVAGDTALAVDLAAAGRLLAAGGGLELPPAARRPVPQVLVDLPGTQTLLMAAAIGAVPLLSAVLGGRYDRDVAARLRHVEEM
ncbi:hypothetical protein, partial [Streptomyces antarcticus]|uniref:hypothetical protein n=1 Tax=Streptomyces antarcticus TaxID=2996458 RepID=UPI0022BECD3F|nr:hypothetical protein [Streptomyces sp. H34-S5]